MKRKSRPLVSKPLIFLFGFVGGYTVCFLLSYISMSTNRTLPNYQFVLSNVKFLHEPDIGANRESPTESTTRRADLHTLDVFSKQNTSGVGLLVEKANTSRADSHVKKANIFGADLMAKKVNISRTDSLVKAANISGADSLVNKANISGANSLVKKVNISGADSMVKKVNIPGADLLVKKANANSLTEYVKHVTFHGTFINCKRIFDGDKDEINRAENYSLSHNHSFSDHQFQNVTDDCKTFKSRLRYRDNCTKEECEFPLAFGILTHDNIEHVERLLRAIYSPHNIYCIHVDAKSSLTFHEAVKSLVKCFPNVFIATKLEKVYYAHFSRLRAEVNCLQDLLKRNHSWKYYLNLASSELPLKSNLEIVKYLKTKKGLNDISENIKRRGPARFLLRHVLFEGYIKRTNETRSKPPHNITMTKGQAYGAFSRDFVQFVFKDQRAIDLLDWSVWVYSPDEYYWATLNNLYSNPFLNTPGGSRAKPEHTVYKSRYIKWNSNGNVCQGTLRHGICVLGVGDLPELRAVNKLIANKFSVNLHPFTVACVEELIRNKTMMIR